MKKATLLFLLPLLLYACKKCDEGDLKFSKFVLYSDTGPGNANCSLETGEHFSGLVYLKNDCHRDLTGVTATFSTSSPYLLALTSSITYGDIKSGQEIAGNDGGVNTIGGCVSSSFVTIGATISNSTPPGTQITINIHKTDDNSKRKWKDDSFTITVN